MLKSDVTVFSIRCFITFVNLPCSSLVPYGLTSGLLSLASSRYRSQYVESGSQSVALMVRILLSTSDLVNLYLIRLSGSLYLCSSRVCPSPLVAYSIRLLCLCHYLCSIYLSIYSPIYLSIYSPVDLSIPYIYVPI